MVTADIRELLGRGARAVASTVHAGDVDVAELAEASLELVSQLAPPGSLIVIDPDQVHRQARALVERLGAGERPPLAGVPVAHKDLFDTRRFPTTYGNPALTRRPDRDATAVARLEAAGAIQVGKANLHELAYGVTGRNPHTGDVTNPAAPGRSPGGSSSGSAAAVAAGAVIASLGTDTGGSVRIPASACGVVGLKTTRGAVPTTGVQPLSWLQDTVGPIAARADDAALLLGVIAGPDHTDPVCRSAPWDGSVSDAAYRRGDARDVTVLVPASLWAARVRSEVADRCRAALALLEDAGARVREIDLDGVAEARRAQGALLAAHALAIHRERLETRPDVFGADVRRRLERARTLTATDVVEALRERTRWIATVHAATRTGILATPTLAFPPPAADAQTVTWDDGEEDVTPALTRLTSIWNLAGTPAISVPTAGDPPVGLQLIGAWWSEPTLLRAAALVAAGR